MARDGSPDDPQYPEGEPTQYAGREVGPSDPTMAAPAPQPPESPEQLAWSQGDDASEPVPYIGDTTGGEYTAPGYQIPTGPTAELAPDDRAVPAGAALPWYRRPPLLFGIAAAVAAVAVGGLALTLTSNQSTTTTTTTRVTKPGETTQTQTITTTGADGRPTTTVTTSVSTSPTTTAPTTTTTPTTTRTTTTTTAVPPPTTTEILTGVTLPTTEEILTGETLPTLKPAPEPEAEG